jgi:hypothetical protein
MAPHARNDWVLQLEHHDVPMWCRLLLMFRKYSKSERDSSCTGRSCKVNVETATKVVDVCFKQALCPVSPVLLGLLYNKV